MRSLLIILLVLGCGEARAPTPTPAVPIPTAPTPAASVPTPAAPAPPTELESEATLPTEVEPRAPLPPVAAIESWLATARIIVTRPTASVSAPAGYERRRGDGLSTWTSEDRWSVITRYAHGVFVVARMEAEPPPPGLRARLLPALHGGRWPHHVIVIDGWDVAVPVQESGAEDWRVPLRQAGEGTLEATARLVHHTDDSYEGTGWMNYGTASDLRVAEGRDIPGGFRLGVSDYSFERPESPQWREPAPVPRSVLSYQTAPAEEDGTLTRILLRQGERLTTAFELDVRNEFEEFGYFDGKVTTVDGLALVHFTLNGWSHYFSLHNLATGERIGEPIATGPSPVGRAHGDAPRLEAIIEEGAFVGFAIFLQDPLVFDAPGRPGRFVPLCPAVQVAPDVMDDDYEDPPYLAGTYYRLRENDGVQCLAPAQE